MNKTQLKAFQSIVGNFSPYFSKINNESMFLDSDLSGDTDRNRQVSIFNIDAKATDLLLTIKGFDQVENNLFRGQVFLNSDENTEILISEPCYYLNKSKVRFSTYELQSYIKEVWHQALNEYKADVTDSPIRSNEEKYSLSLADRFSSFKKSWPAMGIVAAVVVFAGGGYFLGSGTNAKNASSETSSQQLSTSDNPELDGKALALKNMGLDPNSMAFDNSCFKEK